MAIQQQEVWSDINFVQDAQGRLKKLVNVDSVIASIDSILRTNRGERWGLPQFGCNLTGLLHENMNSTMEKYATQEIKEAIETWDDRVIVQQVKFFADPDHTEVDVTVLFAVKSLPSIFKYQTTIR